MKLHTSTKTLIRRISRAVGYEVVPFRSGMTALQQKALERVDLVIDVGANVGQYAERVRALGYGGRIISFEPSTAAFEVLQLKAFRAAGSWHASNKGLGERPCRATLHLSENSVSSSMLQVGPAHLAAAPDSRVTAAEEVVVSTLDLELRSRQAGELLYLKLDVQGLELPVLRGGAETLGNTLAVQVEVSFVTLYEGQTDWLELCAYLGDRGFRPAYVEGGYEDAATGRMLQADLLFLRGD
jgi:FkbM family methyltransferase